MGEGLIRAIRRWDLVAIAINGIIGAGIFGLPSKVYALSGVVSLAAYLVCAIVVMFIVLCFAEVGSRFADTGGPYLYAYRAFGPAVGFGVGWLLWLARLTAFAANCNLMVAYLSYFWPAVGGGAVRKAFIIAVVIAFTLVNLVGVRDAALVSDVFSVAKLAPIMIFIWLGLFHLNPQSFSASELPSYGGFSQSVLLLIYAFTGFEMAVIPAGEVRDPKRDIPVALLFSIALVMLVYLLIQVVCIGTLPGLAASERPLADAASRFMGGAGAALISAGAIISITGNLNVIVLAASRLPFAMSERGQLPRTLSSIHGRFHTPHVSILISAALALALTLSRGFTAALTISTIARLLTYAVTCASLPVLRRREGAIETGFKAPLGTIVSAAVLLLSAWLLSNSSPREARDSAAAALVGLLVYTSYKLWLRWERKAAVVED